MLDSVILTRGEVWVSPELREMVGLDKEDAQVGFALLLSEALESKPGHSGHLLDREEEMAEVARCA